MEDLKKCYEYAKKQGFLSGNEVDKAINNIFYYLDNIDLISYINEFKNKIIMDSMEKLENDICYKDEYFQSLFNIIGEDEFAKYLNKKYNLNIRETIVSYYYIR